MKSFRTNSIIFISLILAIFCCNIYYLANLYRSIQHSVERDVISALVDADIDELWTRAENAQVEAMANPEDDDSNGRPHGAISAAQDSSGHIVSTTHYPDGTVSSEKVKLKGDEHFSNRCIEIIGSQFHAVLDYYVPVDLALMDTIFTRHLNKKGIFPEFVGVEIIDAKGDVVRNNPNIGDGRHDIFSICYNPGDGLYYRAYITSLTRHILSEMAGVIATVLLLVAAFALAFRYLFRTVSKFRTLEEMKDDFINNMTHELKTPIAIAYSANDALLNFDTTNDPSRKKEYLEIANRQLRHLGELVESILAMSMERRKSMPLRPEKILLASFMEEIAEAQRTRCGKKINISVVVLEDDISVVADRSHLGNVMNNLIDNAIKYSGDSVDITVTVDAGSIAVADNGIGIPSKCLPYIFNKFYRVPQGDRQDVSGYGIGLYYVREVLGKMGMSISVCSRMGGGSVFTIRLSGNEV